MRFRHGKGGVLRGLLGEPLEPSDGLKRDMRDITTF